MTAGFPRSPMHVHATHARAHTHTVTHTRTHTHTHTRTRNRTVQLSQGRNGDSRPAGRCCSLSVQQRMAQLLHTRPGVCGFMLPYSDFLFCWVYRVPYSNAILPNLCAILGTHHSSHPYFQPFLAHAKKVRAAASQAKARQGHIYRMQNSAHLFLPVHT